MPQALEHIDTVACELLQWQVRGPHDRARLGCHRLQQVRLTRSVRTTDPTRSGTLRSGRLLQMIDHLRIAGGQEAREHGAIRKPDGKRDLLHERSD